MFGYCAQLLLFSLDIVRKENNRYSYCLAIASYFLLSSPKVMENLAALLFGGDAEVEDEKHEGKCPHLAVYCSNKE